MTKTISLSDSAYDTLSKLKKENESFSEVVLRIGAKELGKDILKYAGIWKEDKEIDRIFKEIEKERHKAKLRNAEF